MPTPYDELLRSLAPSGRSPAGSRSGSTTSSGRCGGHPLIGGPGVLQLPWLGELSSASMGVEALIGVRLPMAISPPVTCALATFSLGFVTLRGLRLRGAVA